MQELELTSARVVRLWWAFTWRCFGIYITIVSITLLVTALFAVFLMRALHFSSDYATAVFAKLMLVSMLGGLPIAGIIAIRCMVQNRSGGFRVALLPLPEEPRQPAHPA